MTEGEPLTDEELKALEEMRDISVAAQTKVTMVDTRNVRLLVSVIDRLRHRDEAMRKQLRAEIRARHGVTKVRA